METLADLTAGYEHEGFFDEAIDSAGHVRGHYEQLLSRLGSISTAALHRAAGQIDDQFLRQGITFTVYGDDEGVERTFPMDLVPRIIPASDWEMIERGLIQRTAALNSFLDDIYAGGAQIIRDGVIPRRLIMSAEGYRPEAVGIAVPAGARCVVAGIDLIRDIDGTYRVLEDNLRSPSGVSYVVENRQAMARLLPHLFRDGRVRPVANYGDLLLSSLRAIAPPGASDTPNVVVLTPGVFNSAYFEHVFLATQLGVDLVEGRDLVVEDHVLYVRTTGGLRRVDVVYRRIDDDFLDPVVFRPDSTLGIAGIMSAARAGNVTIANAVGNGVADDKAVYAYVPAMIRYYLGEEPVIANVDTYLLDDPEQRAAVLARLGELVVKPVAEAGGYGLVIGPTATEQELAELAVKIEADPRNFIAQEVLSLSRHPCLIDGKLEARHIDLRPFVLSGEETAVLPGGLTRVALRKGSLVVNSSQGGGSKDTWVLNDEPDLAADGGSQW